METSKLKGTGVALITPFHKYGTIDFTSLGELVEHVINGGVNYLVALGTTSEAATLTEDEKIAVVEFIVDKAEERVPVIVGVGGNNTIALESLLKKFPYQNVDGILSVTPYYNKPNQKGLYYHFKTLASATDLPIILYNVPSRTSVNMEAETTLKLAEEFSNIVAIKEASGDLFQITKILKDKPKDFLVISGDDALTYNMIGAGASGVISVTANAYPTEYSQMVNSALKNNWKAAKDFNFSLLEFMEAIFEDGNPAGIKSALNTMGIIKHHLRLPLVKVNVQTANRIKQFVDDYKSPVS
ncbi:MULTISPECIES: 4-hydroxy-tetrahydrodipicolinate synthase [unclassified Lentimicrobium]|uniref:4-hydroxy-tetrahydrodipicolinate synthase n=1 Tax=unclassified Lentimicrobium TaxID=2677434 RepID=UPI0015532CCC|nr:MULTISPECIES: 4-hydroxy-tetrahydrodipicolinate synthase [unclassified Lentimicrobium]NPD47118.1 4-hydroxy-tetrahydrodipicolinate synthase [Lentimicrobium sp. S6]NPD83759.1 4-hydroxy-tetrahydrodipicolinate synthase [Lentimicrobium sp. L6]